MSVSAQRFAICDSAARQKISPFGGARELLSRFVGSGLRVSLRFARSERDLALLKHLIEMPI